MNFSNDRDLLVHEPRLFNDVAWLSQQRVERADASIIDDELHCASASFTALQIEAGHIVLINTIAHEVVARINSNTLRVSKLRTRTTDDIIPPEPMTLGEIIVRTFAPQAALVHDVLLRLLGLSTDQSDGQPGEDAVVSLGAIARLETLGTLERIYGSASALDTNNPAHWTKQQHYRRAFADALHHTRILVDLNNDGLAEESRTVGLIQWRRA